MEFKMHQAVINQIAKTLSIDPSIITRESSIQDDLGAGSLDAVEMVIAIEELLEIEEIDDDIAKYWKTVGDVLDYLDEVTT
jgi:acyl carrier protein